MKLLLDTHAWLWFVLGDASLSSTGRSLIEAGSNEKLVSPASYWEVAIKAAIGRYKLPRPYEEFVNDATHGQGFKILPIQINHTAVVATLPFHHRDPFDRLLVAQALAEDIPLLSNDGALDQYGVRRVW